MIFLGHLAIFSKLGDISKKNFNFEILRRFVVLIFLGSQNEGHTLG